MAEYNMYDLTSERDKQAACEEYAKCQQNNLSSSAEERMTVLDEMAHNAGLRFHMENEAAYRQQNALVKPRYTLVSMEKNFADAVADISVDENQLSQ